MSLFSSFVIICLHLTKTDLHIPTSNDGFLCLTCKRNLKYSRQTRRAQKFRNGIHQDLKAVTFSSSMQIVSAYYVLSACGYE